MRIINPEILGYRAIAVDLSDSRPDTRRDGAAHRIFVEEATLTLRHLKAKEAIGRRRSTINQSLARRAGQRHLARTARPGSRPSSHLQRARPDSGNPGRPLMSELVEAINEQSGHRSTKFTAISRSPTRIGAKGVSFRG